MVACTATKVEIGTSPRSCMQRGGAPGTGTGGIDGHTRRAVLDHPLSIRAEIPALVTRPGAEIMLPTRAFWINRRCPKWRGGLLAKLVKVQFENDKSKLSKNTSCTRPPPSSAPAPSLLPAFWLRTNIVFRDSVDPGQLPPLPPCVVSRKKSGRSV